MKPVVLYTHSKDQWWWLGWQSAEAQQQQLGSSEVHLLIRKGEGDH